MSLSKEMLDLLYYEHGLSMAQIATQANCSVNKVSYWMSKYGLKRRDVSKVIYLRQNPTGDPFDIQELTSSDELALFQLALGLYIGEGKKRDKDQVALSNSDSRVIKVFLRFLREICRVDEKRIWAWINIFDDANLQTAKEYWLQVTGLLPEQFHTSVVRPRRGGSYTRLSEFGTLTVGVSSTKLHEIMMRWVNDSLEQYGSTPT